MPVPRGELSKITGAMKRANGTHIIRAAQARLAATMGLELKELRVPGAQGTKGKPCWPPYPATAYQLPGSQCSWLYSTKLLLACLAACLKLHLKELNMRRLKGTQTSFQALLVHSQRPYTRPAWQTSGRRGQADVSSIGCSTHMQALSIHGVIAQAARTAASSTCCAAWCRGGCGRGTCCRRRAPPSAASSSSSSRSSP